ncbi:Fc.00g012030.m01.CDS01 [Cosmosporella sp. VM-42]
MVRFTLAVALSFALGAFALPNPNPNPLTPDPSGDKNIGNGAGGQFITGACLNDADCASGCCATLNGGGICSGTAVSFAQGKQGCGFGGSGSTPPANTSAAPAPPVATDEAAGNGNINTSAPGSQNVGTGSGQQFITGQCFTDADCASKCCAGKAGSSTGACSAIAVSTDSGKTGCGFVQN